MLLPYIVKDRKEAAQHTHTTMSRTASTPPSSPPSLLSQSHHALSRSPAGVAAVEGLSVGQERTILQQARKDAAGTHVWRDTAFLPFVSYKRVNGKWVSLAELVLAFRKGQRRKTRTQAQVQAHTTRKDKRRSRLRARSQARKRQRR